MDKRNYIVDFTKIKRMLNFQPKYSIEYGIKEIIEFLKKNKLDYLEAKKWEILKLMKKNSISRKILNNIKLVVGKKKKLFFT